MVPSAAVALGVAGAGGAYPARVVGARGTRPVCAPAPTGTKRVLVRTRAWSETAKSSKCSPPPSADGGGEHLLDLAVSDQARVLTRTLLVPVGAGAQTGRVPRAPTTRAGYAPPAPATPSATAADGTIF